MDRFPLQYCTRHCFNINMSHQRHVSFLRPASNLLFFDSLFQRCINITKIEITENAFFVYFSHVIRCVIVNLSQAKIYMYGIDNNICYVIKHKLSISLPLNIIFYEDFSFNVQFRCYVIFKLF